jgi:hypothetical protein
MIVVGILIAECIVFPLMSCLSICLDEKFPPWSDHGVIVRCLLLDFILPVVDIILTDIADCSLVVDPVFALGLIAGDPFQVNHSSLVLRCPNCFRCICEAHSPNQ